VLSGRYLELYQAISRWVPAEQLIHDELRTLVLGTDASLYRLVPQLIIKAETEEEVIRILEQCRRFRTPVTFRAAGTSLSGQALSDSVLIYLAGGWKGIKIRANGSLITLQPGVIGAHANAKLVPYQRKIGPDPASINSAMIGGIAANNASGMCCGTVQNSYQTLSSLRVVFADGAVLDTADPESCRQFKQSHAGLLTGLEVLRRRIMANGPLCERIRAKYKLKNTTGYSLNALVDFEDPFDILQHLLIGSEGTLGFLSEITYQTVPELPAKATSLMFFPDIRTACEATIHLKECRVAAVEIMDRAALRSVEDKAGMPPLLKDLDPAVAALLVETRAGDREELAGNIQAILEKLAPLPRLYPLTFTEDPAEFSRLWNIRKGLFPSVGAMRQVGTTVIIEDVAFPIRRLAEATLDLQELFRKHEYREAIIFGHALEGNLHFVFTQDFNEARETRRYAEFMEEVCRLVVEKYDGSLKAEHGTGRNMAPFVEMEWGTEAYQLMRQIKQLFDPENLLNPDVLINSNPQVHLQNFKPLHAVHSLVDKCMECGFCEVNCPSRNLTLTPRQRIVGAREIARLRSAGQDPSRLRELENIYSYSGEATCATDGLCALGCPVGIDTGKLIKEWRFQNQSELANAIADWTAGHMRLVTGTTRLLLNAVHGVHRVFGSFLLGAAASLGRKMTGNRLPAWNPWMPRGASRLPSQTEAPAESRPVVYLPSCTSRTMGVSRNSRFPDAQVERIEALLRKAGFKVFFPENLEEHCCGMAFASKGFFRQGESKLRQLGIALYEVSRNGEYPILVDTSPCLYRLRESTDQLPPLKLYDPVEFALTFLAPKLNFSPLPETIAIHPTCSSQKMELTGKLKELAEMCAARVILPENVGCCGFAGDRGFTYPELNQSALQPLKEALPRDCQAGYSTSRTCEIGLSLHAGIPYQSILYLVDEATTAREGLNWAPSIFSCPDDLHGC
jgi:D-lactate dehydrogenase